MSSSTMDDVLKNNSDSMLLPLTASVIDSSTIIVSSSTAPSTPHSHRSAIVDTIDSPLATLSDVIHPSSSLAPPSPIAYSLDRVLSNLQSFERSIQNGTVRDSLSRYGNVAAIDAMIKLAQFQSERQSSGVVLVLALLQTHSVLLSFWNTANGVDASDQSVGAPSWAQLTTTLTTDQTQVLVKYQVCTFLLENHVAGPMCKLISEGRKIPRLIKWRAEFGIKLYRALEKPGTQAMLSQISSIHISNMRHVSRLWNIHHLGIFISVVNIVATMAVSVVECQALVTSLLVSVEVQLRAATHEDDVLTANWTSIFIAALFASRQSPQTPSQQHDTAAIAALMSDAPSIPSFPSSSPSSSSSSQPTAFDSPMMDSPTRLGTKRKHDSQHGERKRNSYNNRSVREAIGQDGAAVSSDDEAEHGHQAAIARLQSSCDFYMSECRLARQKLKAFRQAGASASNAVPSIDLNRFSYGSWIHSCELLDDASCGRFATMGTAVLMRQQCPPPLVKISRSGLKELTARPDICFFKRSFSFKQSVTEFSNEMHVLSAIQHRPSVHLSTVYGEAGALVPIAIGDGRLSSSNMTQIVHCMTSEYLRGMTLEQWFDDEEQQKEFDRLGQEDQDKFMLKIILQMVMGLKHLHSLGAVHRDIKPSNVMIMSPSIYCTLRNAQPCTLRRSDHPYPGDPPKRVRKVVPESGEAKRSLYADGYAPTCSLHHDDPCHPIVSGPASGIRVVIIDTNTSMMKASSSDFRAARDYNHGVPQYMKSTTALASDRFIGDGLPASKWSSEDHPDRDVKRFWDLFDHFGLVMTIIDVVRRMGIVLKEDEGNSKSSHAANELMHHKYQQYCFDQLKQGLLPSMFGFLYAYTAACKELWAEPDFLEFAARGNCVLSRLRPLRDVLHRASATQWTNEDKSLNISAPVPSLDEIEGVIMQLLSAGSVALKVANHYKRQVVESKRDGSCIFHTFKQQADFIRRGDHPHDFSLEHLAILDGDGSAPNHNYVTALRVGLLNWIVVGVCDHSISIVGDVITLGDIAQSGADSDAAIHEGQAPRTVLDRLREVDADGAVKKNVDRIMRLVKDKQWNTDAGDVVIELLAAMFNVAICIISSTDPNPAGDIIVGQRLSIQTPTMYIYRGVGHFDGTKGLTNISPPVDNAVAPHDLTTSSSTPPDVSPLISAPLISSPLPSSPLPSSPLPSSPPRSSPLPSSPPRSSPLPSQPQSSPYTSSAGEISAAPVAVESWPVISVSSSSPRHRIDIDRSVPMIAPKSEATKAKQIVPREKSSRVTQVPTTTGTSAVTNKRGAAQLKQAGRKLR